MTTKETYRRRAIALRQLATMRRHQYHAAMLTLEMVERDRDEYLERLTNLMAVVARTQQRLGVEHLDDINPAAVLGKRGGQATSPAKTKAVRENGKKGGRPPKSPTAD
jgi:hypothetical protein